MRTGGGREVVFVDYDEELAWTTGLAEGSGVGSEHPHTMQSRYPACKILAYINIGLETQAETSDEKNKIDRWSI